MVESKEIISDGMDTQVKGSTEYTQPEKLLSNPQQYKCCIQKTKSLSAGEISVELIEDENLATVMERLKNEEPPLSLEQVRERRTSIKEQRKESIDLIRNRTASRASASGRPSFEELSKGSYSG